MSFKRHHLPGIVILLLAHAGTLSGCSGEVMENGNSGDPEVPQKGDPPEDDEDPYLSCGPSAYPAISVVVKGGAQGNECLVEVERTGGGPAADFLCAVRTGDCSCDLYEAFSKSDTISINLGETVIAEEGPFEFIPSEGDCNPGGYGSHVFEYAALNEDALTAEELEKMYESARALADATHCSSANDCAAQALGSKACGGPAEYVVYSKLSTDEDALKTAAEELAASETRYNKEQGISSDCAYMEAPEVACESDVCRVATQ